MQADEKKEEDEEKRPGAKEIAAVIAEAHQVEALPLEAAGDRERRQHNGGEDQEKGPEIGDLGQQAATGDTQHGAKAHPEDV